MPHRPPTFISGRNDTTKYMIIRKTRDEEERQQRRGHMLSGWTSRECREGGTTGKNHTHTIAHASLSAICSVCYRASPPNQTSITFISQFPMFRHLSSLLPHFSVSSLVNLTEQHLCVLILYVHYPSVFACMPECVCECVFLLSVQGPLIATMS